MYSPAADYNRLFYRAPVTVLLQSRQSSLCDTSITDGYPTVL